MKTFAKSLSILLMLLLALSCSKEDTLLPAGDELTAALKKATSFDGTYELKGLTHFPSYAVKEHKVIAPWEENKLCCEALLIVDRHNFTLEIREIFPGFAVIREVTFVGQISSSGVVKFSWPDEWSQIDGDKTLPDLGDEVLAHTGCEIYGPGNDHGVFCLDYEGKFDGDKFYASSHFMAKQIQFGNGMAPWYTEDNLYILLGREGYIDGPIQFEFIMDLQLCEVDCNCPLPE